MTEEVAEPMYRVQGLGVLSINHGRRRTMAYWWECPECDLCDKRLAEDAGAVLVLPPWPWSGINICRQCWDELGKLWDDDEPPSVE